MNIDLENTLALAVAWAKEVGEIQCSYFRSGHLELETKSTVHDVVTKVDKLSESMLIERIGKCFPGHSVLGEESGKHDAHSDYLWVVDPLDGTNNYSQGLPVFCVSIGLQYRGETLLGDVYKRQVLERAVHGNPRQRGFSKQCPDPCFRQDGTRSFRAGHGFPLR